MIARPWCWVILGYILFFIDSTSVSSFMLPLHSSPKLRATVAGNLQLQRSTKPLLPNTSAIAAAAKKRDGGDLENLSQDQKNKNNGDDNAWLWSCVLPLWLVYIANQWNRYSINSLVDFSDQATVFTAMNVELNFNQAEYGILASIAFTVLYSVCTLGAGFAADVLDRRALTIGSTVAWSLATLATAAVATTYQDVLFERLALGAACSVSAPTAYALIADAVPASRVGLATSIYSTAVAVASGLASLSLLLDAQVGWRNTLVVIGLAGIVSAIVALLLLEDPRNNEENAKRRKRSLSSQPQVFKLPLSNGGIDTTAQSAASDVQVWNNVKLVLETSRVRWLLVGSLLRFGSGLCIGVWSAPYFRIALSTSDRVGDYAIAQAAIAVIGASASGIAGGALADRLTEGGGADVGRRLWVPVAGSLLATPAWYYAIHADSFEMTIGLLAFEYLAAECWFGPTISTLQATVAGKGVSGTAQGIFTLTGGLANAAPSVLGYMYSSSANTEGVTSSAQLANYLSTFVCFGYVASSLCFGLAALSTPPLVSKPTKL